jgi:hypothetical protein
MRMSALALCETPPASKLLKLRFRTRQFLAHLFPLADEFIALGNQGCGNRDVARA